MDTDNIIPKISVIIPVFNVEKYLTRCLESVLGQTYRELDVILVDDGSTDNSGTICDRYASDSRVTVIHKENGGVSSARNAGIDAARGEYIGFVDPDDYLAEDMYEYLYRLIQSNDADISQCGIYDCYADRTDMPAEPECFEITDRTAAMRLLLEAKVTSMHMVNKLYRAELLREVRFRDFSVAEDALFLTELMQEANRIVLTNRPKYYYYHRPDSLTSSSVNAASEDWVRVYDRIYELAQKISPGLEEPARMRRCWARFVLLDKMYASRSAVDEDLERELIDYLKGQKALILRKDYLSTGRRMLYAGMLIDKRLYRAAVKWFYDHHRLVNEGE